jgi:hypothetical protein
MDKLLVTLRLSGATLSELQRISESINSLMCYVCYKMLCYDMLCKVMYLNYDNFLFIMLLTILSLHIMKCEINYVVRKCNKNIMKNYNLPPKV